MVKSEAEVRLLRESCRIGAEAVRSAMAATRSLGTEGAVLATVEHSARMAGACHPAYPPVVAAGNNATVIHYIAATGAVAEGDLVLVDAGCEYHGYSSDITRTWPAAGSWSAAQLELYEALLAVQLQLVAGIRPGLSSVDSLYRDMQQLLARELGSLGLVDRDGPYLSARVHDLCPHHVSHYLGMDVHDCGRADKRRPLEAGMVITVEPGLYIPPASRQDRTARWRGLGARIEDDILITEDGAEVLSAACPKTVEDIKNTIL